MDKNQLLHEGFRHFAGKEYEDAEKYFLQALETDDKFALAYNALAETYNKMGRLDDAINIAQKMISLTPDDPVSHTALSRLYVQKGMIEEAEKEMAISNHLAQKK